MWVKVTRVLVSAVTLPFTVKRQPKTLATLMQHNAHVGKDPVLVVSRSHLRDADHRVEKRLAEKRAHAARPVLPVESQDGQVDALVDLQGPIQRLRDTGVVPGGAGSGAAADFGDVDDADVCDGAGLAGNVGEDEEDGIEPRPPADEEGDGGGGPLRGLAAGVKGDIMHLMDRVLRHVPKGHGATPLFSRAFSHALMFYNAKDAAAAQRLAAEIWLDKTWRQVQYYMAAWVNRRVRRTVPHPDIIAPRLEKLFKDFAGILYASNKQPLFTSATWKAARQVIQLVKEGWVTDPVDAPLYVLRRYDHNNLPLWLCSRGTNSNEGSVHQKLVENFLGMKGTSAELISFALLEWVGRHNQRAARNYRTGAPDMGHPDVWIVDDIIFYQQFIFGERVSHHAHQRADEFELPEFYCGVTTLSPDILEDCGLPGKEMMEQLSPTLPALPQQKRYLAKKMGTGVPLLPVHTTEEKLLYGEVQRKLRRELGGRPSAADITVAFNRVVGDDWLRCAAKMAAADATAAKVTASRSKKKALKAVKLEQPSLYFKSTSHMVAYQAFYDRTQHEASTILLSHPVQSRTTAAASNSTTADFVDDATTMTPVASQAAPQRRPRTAVADQRAGAWGRGQGEGGAGATHGGQVGRRAPGRPPSGGGRTPSGGGPASGGRAANVDLTTAVWPPGGAGKCECACRSGRDRHFQLLWCRGHGFSGVRRHGAELWRWRRHGAGGARRRDDGAATQEEAQTALLDVHQIDVPGNRRKQGCPVWQRLHGVPASAPPVGTARQLPEGSRVAGIGLGGGAASAAVRSTRLPRLQPRPIGLPLPPSSRSLHSQSAIGSASSARHPSHLVSGVRMGPRTT